MTLENTNSTEIKGQVDLFDLLPEEERPEEVKKTEPIVKGGKSVAAAKSTTVKPKEEPEPDVYDKDRIVFYAGHRYEIKDRTLKLEEIRNLLETGFQYHEEKEVNGEIKTRDEWVEFPELKKDRAEMVYDKEQGHIIPVLKGHKKGGAPVYTEHPQTPMSVYNFIDTDEGTMYTVRRTQTGLFAAPIVGPGNKHLSITEMFTPRIALGVIQEILSVFKEDTTKEHLAYVTWDSYRGYSAYWPRQIKTKTSVEGEKFMDTEERFRVLQIHSHNTMSAFFSDQDDLDEEATGYYAVVGRCHHAKPDLRMRYSCGGRFVDIDPRRLIVGPIEKEVNLLWN